MRRPFIANLSTALVVMLAVVVGLGGSTVKAAAPDTTAMFAGALGALSSKFSTGVGVGCTQYPPTYPNGTESMCAGYVTWLVDGARASSQVGIETQLKDTLAKVVTDGEQLALQTMFPVCYESVKRFMCTQAYPVCTAGSRSPGLACKTTCDSMVSQCKIPFMLQQKADQLPQCGSQALAPFFDNSGSCNKVTAAPGKLVTPRACPDYMVTYNGTELNPYNNPNNTLGGQCFGRCCFPAPKMPLFYQTGQVDFANQLSVYMRAVSSIAALFVFLSYLVLPNKRKHPAIIVLFFAFGMTLWMGSIWMSFPNPLQIQRATDPTQADGLSPFLEARFTTNQQCTIQGTLLIFFAHLTIVWAVYLVLNLHLSAVWRSNFLERHFHVTSLFCWVWPLVFTIAGYLTSAIEYNAGATCFLSADRSSDFFFYPLAGLIGIATILHCWTFWSIARTSFMDSVSMDNSATVSQSASRNGKSSDPYGGGGQSSHGPNASYPGRSMGSTAQGSGGVRRAKHAVQAVRVQWRPLLLAMQLIVTFIVFFLFYKFEASKLQIDGSEQWFKEWVVCTMIERNGQDKCAAAAASNLPPYWLTMVTDIIVSMAGLLLFVIFGARKSLFFEWNTFFATLGRKRTASDPYAHYL